MDNPLLRDGVVSGPRRVLARYDDWEIKKKKMAAADPSASEEELYERLRRWRCDQNELRGAELTACLDGVGDAPVAYDDAAHGGGWLEAARARDLPLLVANPDLVRPDGKDSPMPWPQGSTDWV